MHVVAYRLVNAEGVGRFVRFRLEPEGGVASLPAEQQANADNDYLMIGVLRDGDILVNDPMRVTDGIEPCNDPILHIRPLLYAESVRRRTSGL